MGEDTQKNTYKKFVLLVTGFLVLILGITLILVWQEDLMALVRGSIGMILALGGLFMLYAINKVSK